MNPHLIEITALVGAIGARLSGMSWANVAACQRGEPPQFDLIYFNQASQQLEHLARRAAAIALHDAVQELPR